MKKVILSLAILAATFTAAAARTLKGNKTIKMPVVAVVSSPNQQPQTLLADIIVEQKEMGDNGRTITISIIQDGRVLQTWQKGGNVYVEFEGSARNPEYIEVVDSNFRYMYISRDERHKNYPVLFNYLTNMSDGI